jgi:hypothetical protein
MSVFPSRSVANAAVDGSSHSNVRDGKGFPLLMCCRGPRGCTFYDGGPPIKVIHKVIQGTMLLFQKDCLAARPRRWHVYVQQ